MNAHTMQDECSKHRLNHAKSMQTFSAQRRYAWIHNYSVRSFKQNDLQVAERIDDIRRLSVARKDALQKIAECEKPMLVRITVDRSHDYGSS